jgi:eukaryotic-like serine/threonine-protein kinase
VVGVTLDQAKAALSDMKLVPDVTLKHDDTVPKGQVMSQSPVGNATAPQGSKVHLVVSNGPPMVPVPSVVGKNVGEAQQLIIAAGLTPNVQQLPGGPGTVLNQSPNGGDKAPKGSTVTLYVF